MLVYLDLDDEGYCTIRSVKTDRPLTNSVDVTQNGMLRALRMHCEREGWIVKGRVGFDDEVNPKTRIHIEMEKPKKRGWLARIGL